LVEKKADFNLQTKGGYTPLHLAVLGNHTTILDLLVSLNLSLNSKSKSKVSNATDRRASLTSQTTLAASENQDEQSPSQPNIDAKSKSGQTAMHLAAAFGYIESLTRLMEATGTMMERDATGRTPLHFAASNGHRGTITALLQQNVDPDVTDDESYTALHYAVEGGYQDVTKALLAGKAHADAGRDSGITPCT
jgi:ankyrin repeat protein